MPRPDPTVERDLAELDAALSGSAAADPRLVDLVRDVRACAPSLRPAFASALGDRVAAGFATPGRERRGRWTLPTRLVPALGVAATVLAGLVVGLSTRGGHEGSGHGVPSPVAKAPAAGTGTP